MQEVRWQSKSSPRS